MTGEEVLEIARRVVEGAPSSEQIEAYAIRSRDTEIAVFDGEVESLSVAEVEGLGVRVLCDGRQGFAWVGSHDPDMVRHARDEARDNARFGEVDQWYRMARPEDVAGDRADLDLWRDEVLALGTDEKVDMALEADRATKAADSRVRGVESAGYGDGAVTAAIVNSNGVESTSRRTTCALHAVAMAGDGNETRTGYGFTAARSPSELDVASVPRDASLRAVRLLGAEQPGSRRIAVVLDPLVTRSFLGLLSGAFNGEAVLKGRSIFEGREGEQVAAAGVTIVDDPTDDRALGASPVDSEGVPTRRNELVRAGKHVGVLHNLYTGARSGAGTTASAVRGYSSMPGVGVRALRFEPGRLEPDAILTAAGEALYVQSVSGLHSGTNPVSGAFSVGAEGLMIRDGAFAEPVREVTIASTLQRMLLDVAEVGADLTFLPGTVAGQTLLISEMMMSGR